MKIIELEGEKYFAIMTQGQAGAGRVVAFPQQSDNKPNFLPLPNANFKTWIVCGDSLNTNDPNTTICDGDQVIARTDYENGSVFGRLCVLRLYGSEIAIKRVFNDRNGILRLESNRPQDTPEYVEANDVEILGIVKFFLRKA